MTSTAASSYHRLNISDPDFWAADFRTRDQTFAELRAEGGLSWQPPTSSVFPHTETGYWAVTRHADIKTVSVNNDVFVSSLGISVDPMPAEVQQAASFILAMDDPKHAFYRRLISKTFTPRQIHRIEGQIRANATEIVDQLIERLRDGEEVDFVAECSAKLPMRTISDMVGIAREDQEAVAYAAESLFSGTDEDYASLEDRATHALTQLGVLTSTALDLARLRRREPHDDLMTALVNAEVDGKRMSDDDIAAFTVILSTAGNDTTKQTTSHAFKALTDNPDQRAWLLDDFDNRIGLAVEEFVRWATPVLNFARHAVVDTELAGVPIRAGEKVGIFYCSANRDEAVFDRPHTFDIARSPNPHLGFGGGGAHFCLGAQLARMELRQLFAELLTRLTEVEVGTPEYLNSNVIHGIKRMPVKLA
ncbi:cytochrome P450 [Mycolicibacterium septicum DSM 44393]|uniref:Steroid C26-monooxygenase n=1 Tax=Mycolicibacterium septicum DSM 44393 TaxID=1341646 RepID=A0A7X6MP58_9MYCO|nr:cytochrome P450 [Mycolicibacterium septicum]NKZ11373.1 cytochrome P450 [Mycolicibacterium septicum DSM 44393]